MKERRREWINARPRDRDLARRRFLQSVQAFNAVVLFEESPMGLVQSGESELLEPQLTPREVQVLEKIAMGLTSKEIAQELNISFKTAVTHRSNLMGKFQVGNVALLIRRAIAAGYMTGPGDFRKGANPKDCGAIHRFEAAHPLPLGHSVRL